KGGDKVQPGAQQQQEQQGEGEHIHRAEAPHRLHYPIAHGLAAQFDREDAIGMQQALDLPYPLLEHQHHPDDLHAAAGGAGAGTDETGIEQYEGQYRGPGGEVGHGKTGGGGDGHRLEGGEAQRRGDIVILEIDQQYAADDEQSEQYLQIGAAFRVLPVTAYGTEAPGGEMQGKGDTGQDHEQHADQLDRRAVVIADAGVMGGEAANGHGGKTVADGIEQRHASQPVGARAGQGQATVDEPQYLGGLGDAWGELVFLQRTRHLRPVQLHAADAQQRQYRYGQHDDPHATEPLQLLAVEQQGARQGIEPGDHGGAGGRQPGEGFEHRISDGQVGAVQQIQRHRPEQPQYQPEQDGNQVAVTGAQLVTPLAHR